MDRCRCDEYAEAVKKLRFYTVGTLRPDIIDNYDRSGYAVVWVNQGVSYNDFKFSKPRVSRVLEPHELPENQLSEKNRQIEQMWCPFMTPIKH